MKSLVRVGAGVAIWLILASVFIWDAYVYRFPVIIAIILICVGVYEGIDMSRWWGGDDDDDGNGPMRPA